MPKNSKLVCNLTDSITSSVVTVLFIFIFAGSSAAQIFQSSGFIKIKEKGQTATTTASGNAASSNTDNSTIQKGKGYLTIKVADGRIFDDNPGVRFWKTNRKLISLFTTEGSLFERYNLNQGRMRSVASPNNITLNTIKNGTPYSLNWGNIILVEGIPNDFNGLKVTSKITTNTDNGFDDIFNVMQQVTSVFPNLTANAATQGILSGTKSVVDFLVKDKLNQPTIDVSTDISYGMQTGYYVNFASQNPNAWKKYQENAQNLSWNANNNILTLRDGEQDSTVEKVSYIVIQIQVTSPWNYTTLAEWQKNVFAIEDKQWKADFNRAYYLAKSGDTAASDVLKDNVKSLIDSGKRDLRADNTICSSDKINILAIVDSGFASLRPAG